MAIFKSQTPSSRQINWIQLKLCKIFVVKYNATKLFCKIEINTINHAGNVVMDTAINGLIILLMGTLTASVGSVWQGLSWHRIKYGVLQLLGYRRQSLNLRGMITRTGEKNWESFTHRFKAVLFRIKDPFICIVEKPKKTKRRIIFFYFFFANLL